MAAEVKMSPINLSDLRNQFGTFVVESMQEMVQGSEKAKQEKNIERGIWYPDEYIQALEGKGKRYDLLRAKCHLVDGFLPQQFFDPLYAQVGEYTKRRTWSFSPKADRLPSAALKAAKAGLSILDCGAVCQLARYDALLKILGEGKFDRLFGKDHGQPINTTFQDDESQPLRYFFRFTDNALALAQRRGKKDSEGNRIVQRGQMVSFQGVDRYKQKFPGGVGGEYNLICLTDTPGQQRFIGHGLPLDGLSEEEIALLMVREYNKVPDHYSRVAVAGHEILAQILEERKTDELKTHTVSEKKPLKQVKGFDPRSPQDVCIELIADLIERPLEQVSMAYVKRHPKANRNFS